MEELKIEPDQQDISGLQQGKQPLTVLIAEALSFTQPFQLPFGARSILTFPFQVENQPLLLCKLTLS
ncbi:hypothetical protein XI06_31385 [Bradyrhizobium sp. CCBAU 11434]|uniref:hypothetical protein n=1 Tax=Bradyrhizobium TaxID=374 RepID=UPI001EDB9597|nr:MULTISPECIES: hypothetical protein [Bradyrhizobium]MCG2642844.1 hypothetical protein [Bradyrhizobium zhengyangense]MDA9524674.1 hypothetical protein [Bradyrhizobium sp. CCBAU 11434]